MELMRSDSTTSFFFFFLKKPPPPEIYPLPPHRALPIKNRHFCVPVEWFREDHTFPQKNALYVEHALDLSEKAARRDRKSTRLNSSHANISYAVFCLKKKINHITPRTN